MDSVTNGRLTKSFSVFDCDAHVNDPLEIWRDYVDPQYRELVRQSYWRDDEQAIVNGRTVVIGGTGNGCRGGRHGGRRGGRGRVGGAEEEDARSGVRGGAGSGV